MRRLPDDALEPVLVPLDGLGVVDTVGSTNLGLRTAAARDTLTRAGPGEVVSTLTSPSRYRSCHVHADVKVHAVDTDRRIVLDTEINVLGDTETEVASLREVALAELVLLDLEATLENLLGLGATDSDVDGDLLVTTDTKGTDSVASLA